MLTLKKKQTMFSVLRAIAYFASFPLLLLVVLLCSTQFRHSAPFQDTWYLGILICAIPWFLTAVLQIVFGFFVKNQNLKTIVIVLVTAVVMVGSAGVIDIYGASVIKKAQETYSSGKYAEANVEINDYYKQVNWFITLSNEKSYTDKFSAEYSRFTTVYNLEINNGRGSSRSSVNTDGSPAVKGKEKGLGLTDATVSPNGLLADGWIFSVQDAMKIISVYYEAVNKAEAAGIDLEEKYDDIITVVKNGDPYKDYQSKDEYKKAYGENGSAYHYMIGKDKLNQMIPVVTKYLALVLTDVGNFGGSPTMSLVNGIIDVNVLAQVNDLNELLTFVNETIKSLADLSMEGLDLSAVLKPDGNYLTLTEADVLSLLETYSYYVSPQARPIFDFIAETEGCDVLDTKGNVILTAAEVQAFAYARYYGKTHGANIGSVLIPTKNADDTYSNIGQITMNDSGYPSTFAFTLEEIYGLEASMSYIPQLYPVLAARRCLYIFAGICALCMMLFYQFLRREEEIIDEMIVQGGAM